MDIAGYITTQEPVASWTSAKKQALLDRFCNARGYVAQYDGNNNLIQTKKEFFNQDIVKYIKIMCEGDARQEAVDAVTYETFDLN